MNSLPPNPIFEFNPNQMAEVRKIFNYEDLNRLHQDINLFEDWIKMQHHFNVKKYDKEYIERYLITSKGSIERAKKRLDKLCTLRGLMPEYLQGFDIQNEFDKLHKISYLCWLPYPTAAHTRVLYYSIHNPEAEYFDHSHIARYMIVMMEYLYCNDYTAGIDMVVDTRNFTLGIVTKVSAIIVKNILMIITEALGLRMRGFHLLCGSKFVDALVTIMKQGMSKKLQSRLHVHEVSSSLFDFIDKEKLPEELGGTLGPAKEISENNFKEFTTPEFLKVVKDMEGATTNESKRLRSTFNAEYSGMPGSFKVLSVD